MDREPLDRIDSFPYRHRVADIMSAPLVAVAPATPAHDAVALMVERGISSVFVEEGGAIVGIVTERDILRQCLAAADKTAAVQVGDIMSAPVFSVRAADYVFVALGRMARRNVRHLLVTDAEGHGAGVLTARSLLKVRAGDTLRLGDELADATDARGLAHVRAQLPHLARQMLAEDVDALNVSSVISAVYCDMTRRAWDIAVAAMAAEGRGPVPAPVSVLVLGSGGRGESMLKPDQDNALVHLGSDADDAWFAEAAERMNDILDAAGVPFCKGDVMARNPYWRRTLKGWDGQLHDWIQTKDPHAIMMTDIFFDFVVVAGDPAPARALRDLARDTVRRAQVFLTFIGARLEEYTPPIGLLGRFRTENGRLDLKMKGLMPIVGGVRAMALQHGITATSTRGRLDGLVAAGVLGPDDADQVADAHAVLQRLVLDQQLADLAAGQAPGNRVEVARLGPRTRRRLKGVLGGIEGMKLMVKDSLEASFRKP